MPLPGLAALHGIWASVRQYFHHLRPQDFGVSPVPFAKARRRARRWSWLETAGIIFSVLIGYVLAATFTGTLGLIVEDRNVGVADGSPLNSFEPWYYNALFLALYPGLSALLARRVISGARFARLRLVRKILRCHKTLLATHGVFSATRRGSLSLRLTRFRRRMDRDAWILAAEVAQCAGFQPSVRTDERWSRLSRALHWSMQEPWEETRIRLGLRCCALALARIYDDGQLLSPLDIEVGGELVRPSRRWAWFRGLQWRDVFIATLAGVLVLFPDKGFDLLSR